MAELAFRRPPAGYLAFVLHAHLPYVRHPEHEHFLEEDWLYEAIAETYVPLLAMLEGLVHDGVAFRMTMSLTPTLCAMLDDELLRARFRRRINRLIDLAEREEVRLYGDRDFAPLAHMYKNRFVWVRDLYEDHYQSDLVSAFARLQHEGVLEILTCGATHGFLPNLRVNPAAVRAQIHVGADTYRRRFGRNPPGIWLPECGYYPGVEDYLKAHDIRYFLTDYHGVVCATPAPPTASYRPIYCPAGVAAFCRDLESSEQVWSSKSGYPGDYAYREFYRDIGWDLDWDYIKDDVQPTGDRKNTGIKYYAITGPTPHKRPYREFDARETAARHAGDFVHKRAAQISSVAGMLGTAPIVTAPYDAELFGHWWYEGVWFLDYVFRKTAYDQDVFAMTSPGEFLARYPEQFKATPAFSSWGAGGYGSVWLSGANDWIYRHLHRAADRMVEIAHKFGGPDTMHERTLNQAARELLLAQASDWAFIMKTGTMVEYAERRTKLHLLRFNKLYESLHRGEMDREWFEAIAYQDNLFPDLDYRVYRDDWAA